MPKPKDSSAAPPLDTATDPDMPEPVTVSVSFTLPLTLQVRSVRLAAPHIEIECVLSDAEEKSVAFWPLTMSSQASIAEVESVLQQSVASHAKTLYDRGLARLPEESPLRQAQGLEGIVGKTYRGSVIR